MTTARARQALAVAIPCILLPISGSACTAIHGNGAGLTELDWADTVAFAPDPKAVRDAGARSMIAATGLPWLVRSKAIGIEFVLVPPGEFMMGAADGESDEAPPHRVRITRPYYISRFEITRADWSQLATAAPPTTPALSRLPQAEVTYLSALEFATAASSRIDAALDIPTEAEWEWAARGPSPTVYPWGSTIDSTMANYDSTFEDDSDDVELVSVDRFSGSSSWCGASGLAGGVTEWCKDWYSPDSYGKAPPLAVDPTGPAEGTQRVLRGGAWFDGSPNLRCTRRSYAEPDFISDGFGLRLCVRL